MSDSSTGNYGENLVENGEFTSSAIGWNLSGGAIYSEGSILCPSEGSPFKTISQPLAIIPEKQYLVRYTLSVISGNITSSVLLGDSGFSHGNASGTLSAILTPTIDGFVRISIETTAGGEATVDDVVVREYILDSESSSLSGKSSLSSSDSSTELMSSSLSTNSSSITTFSSDSSITSLSSTSFSQSSSVSSGQFAYFDFPFKIEAFQESPVWCFERVGENVYAGTGREGVVLQSKDLNIWNVWKIVEDSHIKSLKLYANGLFIGTEPNGYIYVYNFSTQNFYRFVETFDHAVNAMAVFRGELYAGTSPGGTIYTYNGDFWYKQNQFYGGGITSLFVHDDKLYASIKSAESIMVYDGSSWKVIPISNIEVPEDLDLIGLSTTEGMVTVASNRNLSTEPVSEDNFKFINRVKISNIDAMISDKILDLYDALVIQPLNPESNIESISSFEGNLLIGGKRGRVLKYDGEMFKTIHDNNDSGIVSISSDGFFCSENSLFVIPQSEQNNE